MDKEKFERFMYFLIKDACKYSFEDFLTEHDLNFEDYEEIAQHLSNDYGIKLYL